MLATVFSKVSIFQRIYTKLKRTAQTLIFFIFLSSKKPIFVETFLFDNNEIISIIIVAFIFFNTIETHTV